MVPHKQWWFHCIVDMLIKLCLIGCENMIYQKKYTCKVSVRRIGKKEEIYIHVLTFQHWSEAVHRTETVPGEESEEDVWERQSSLRGHCPSLWCVLVTLLIYRISKFICLSQICKNGGNLQHFFYLRPSFFAFKKFLIDNEIGYKFSIFNYEVFAI